MFEINLWLLVMLMEPFVNIQSLSCLNLMACTIRYFSPPKLIQFFGLLIGHEFDTVFSSSLFLGVVDLKAEGGAWVEAVCVVGEVR